MKRQRKARGERTFSHFVEHILDEDGGGEAFMLEGVAVLKLEHLHPRPADGAEAEAMLARWAGYLSGKPGAIDRQRMVRRYRAGVGRWWDLSVEHTPPWFGGLL